MANNQVLKRELQLVFMDSQKKEVVIHIAYPKDDITASDIEQVAQVLVEKDVIRSGKDTTLTSFIRGDLVTTTSVTVE